MDGIGSAESLSFGDVRWAITTLSLKLKRESGLGRDTDLLAWKCYSKQKAGWYHQGKEGRRNKAGRRVLQDYKVIVKRRKQERRQSNH